MNKFTYAAISLIGAIPGGYLAYLMVMAMVNHFSEMVTMMRVLTGLTLAAAAVVAVMPIGILVFASKPKTEEEDEDEEESASLDEDAVEDADPDAFQAEAFDDDDAEHEPPNAQLENADSEESVVIETEGMFEDDIYEEDETPPKK